MAAGGSVDDALFDTSVEFGPGKAYDVIAVDMADNLDAMVENVDLSVLPEGQARLRLFHTARMSTMSSWSSPMVQTLVDGVGFKDVSDYQTVDAGTYDIQLKQGDDVLIRVQDFTVEAGQVYDVLAIGRADDQTLQLIAFTAPAELPTGGEASPEAGATPMTAEEATQNWWQAPPPSKSQGILATNRDEATCPGSSVLRAMQGRS